MSNDLFDDREESQSFENFQQYQSFDDGILDNGILDNEILDNGILDNEILDNKMPDPGSANPEILDYQSFDAEIHDAPHNFDKAIVPGTIDSRSFTHTEADWERIQEEAAAVSYADSAVSWNEDKDGKTQNFFHVFLAFLVSIIVAAVFVLINILVYNIEYISTVQCLMSMLPTIALFTCFYHMTGKRAMKVFEGVCIVNHIQ